MPLALYISAILLLIVFFEDCQPARHLAITLYSPKGIALRRNALYLNSNDQNVYKIFCGLPPGELPNSGHIKDSLTFTWIPIGDHGYGNITDGSFNASLALSGALPKSILNFNCTTKKPTQEFLPTTFKFYKNSKLVLTDTSSSLIFLNWSDPQLTPIQLSCRPPVSPKLQLHNSKIRWFLDEHEIQDSKRVQIHDGNGTLTINHPMYTDMGIYLCKVADDMTVFASYSIVGAPTIPSKFAVDQKDSVIVNIGENATIFHEIFANPLNPIKIRWQRKVGDTVEHFDDNFVVDNPEFQNRIVFSPNDYGPNARLLLIDVQKNDRAEFIIFVENDFGKANFTTLVRVKGMIDALYPSIGIIVEVILLFVIIFLYEKRRALKEQRADFEDENKNSSIVQSAVPVDDRSGNSSELRRRKT